MFMHMSMIMGMRMCMRMLTRMLALEDAGVYVVGEPTVLNQVAPALPGAARPRCRIPSLTLLRLVPWLVGAEVGPLAGARGWDH